MTAEELRQFSQAVPFQPFDIQLADGRSCPVTDRNYIAIAPTGRKMIVGGVGDSVVLIDLAMIRKLRVRPPAPARVRRRRKLVPH